METVGPDSNAAFHPEELAEQRAFLCRLARSLVGDRAEDVVQDSFVRALERPPPAGATLRGWLATVVRRRASNERRRASRAREHERAAARSPEVASHAEAAAQLDAQQLVLAAVRALDEPYRTAIWLRYYEDLAPAAIAARQALPVKTVKTRLARGLERLRAELDRQSGGARSAWSALVLPFARRGAAGGGSGPGAGWLGGVLAMKKLIAVAAVLGLLWLVWPGRGQAPGPGAEPALAATGSAGVEAAHGTVALAAAEVPLRVALDVVPGGERGGSEDSAPALATLLVRVRHADGTAGRDVGLTLWPRDSAWPDLDLVELATDGAGEARFVDVAAGVYSLQSDRDERRELTLEEGETRMLELELERGLDVSGIVLAPDGRPVAGAELLLQRRTPALSAAQVAGKSGADGRFALRALDPEDSLAACAGGYAPSFVRWFREGTWPADDPRLELTLALRPDGAALRGLVLDPEGLPVRGARVAVGSPDPGPVLVASGRWETGPRTRFLRTDERGAFEIASLEAGPESVQVLAEGLAQVRAEVVLEAGHTEELVLRLERGVHVGGTARFADGRPAVGARVRPGQLAGAAALASPFQLPRSKADAEGRYALEHVPSGELVLLATASDSSAGARVRLTAPVGADLVWDPELTGAEVLSGRVQDGSGRALAGWSVYAESMRSGRFLLQSDAEGRFALHPPVAGEEWSLDLMEPRRETVQDHAAGVRAGDEIVLVGRSEEGELGRITGRFVDSAGRVSEGASVSAIAVLVPDADATSGSSFAEPVPVEDGSIVLERLPPGRYLVHVMSGSRSLASADGIVVAAGQTSDAGTLASEPVGTLVLTLAGGLAAPGLELAVLAGHEYNPLACSGAEWRLEDLHVGRYRLHSSLVGLTLPAEELEVAAGRETRRELALNAGARRDVCLAVTGSWKRAEVRVRAADGSVLTATAPNTGEPEARCAFWLGPGAYALEASTDTGLAASGAFEVTALGVAQPEVRLELR